MCERLEDFVYENSAKLALAILLVLLLGFALFQIDYNIGSGMSPQYFQIALLAAFIALFISSGMERDLIRAKTLLVPVAVGFILLFVADIYIHYNGIAWAPRVGGGSLAVHDSSLAPALIMASAFAVGALAVLLVKRKKGLSLREAMQLNFVVYAKILMIYFVVAVFSAVWMESFCHQGGPCLMLDSYLSLAWLLQAPIYHMAIFMLGSTAGSLLLQRLRK